MKTKFTFSGEQRITAQLVSGNYLWLAFYGVSSACALYKSSVFSPNIRYWNVSVTANEIKSMTEDTTYLYTALDHSIYIGAKITKATPTTIAYFTKNVGITEEAIDLINSGSFTYFLTPGIASGINAKISKHNTSTRAFVENIDLSTVTDARKIDVDVNGVLWIQSNLDGTPLLTKVWYSGTWQYQNYILS